MNFSLFIANVLLVTCVTNFKIVEAEIAVDKNAEDKEVDLLDDHTFVALIDIVFTDGSKRTCTGSIIHDNVVITAAHCFTKERNRDVEPEITASFVVIGTKKMFETGYEQYLPIERVLTHPGVSGWNADLSLVYTFAAMTSDKPGTVIPIATKSAVNFDSNLTVLSWGNMKEYSQNDWSSKQENEQETSCSDSTSQEDYQKVEDFDDESKVTAILQLKKKHQPHHKVTLKQRAVYEQDGILKQKTENKLEQRRVRPKTKVMSRYLSGEERVSNEKHQDIKTRHQTTMQTEQELSTETKMPLAIASFKVLRHNYETIQPKIYSIKSHYKNWRRLMGSQHNQLTVEVFRLVDIRDCKKLVKKAKIEGFDALFANSNIVCYAAQEHFISDEDSGAPVVHRGQLIAVTVGGVEYDGDHVAVGMKMTCYCSWLADHLPNGGDLLNCPKNCTDVEHKEEKEHKHKNSSKRQINKLFI